MSLNLYLVSRSDVADWDEYRAFVVAAANSTDAKLTHPSGDIKNWQNIDPFCATWVDDVSY